MGPRRWGRGRHPQATRRDGSIGFNGAATMGSRKTAAIAAAHSPMDQLQWGRDDGVAEDHDQIARSAAIRASMGPRRWGRGRRCDGIVGARGTARASMGPRRWGRGRRDGSGTQRSASTASMGPRRWGRGRRHRPPYARRARASMGPRRWGRGRPSAHAESGDVAATASMGPRRWGRGRHAADRTQRPAVAMLQWGRDDGVAEDDVDRIRLDSRTDGFNGAATMGSRKTSRREHVDAERWQLQWGRDDGVAEDLPRHRHGRSCRGASMGPRRWGRGRPVAVVDDGDVDPGFNGAATMGSRKTSLPALPGSDRIDMLQWGRDDGVAEDRSRTREVDYAASSFNGAATMGSRKTQARACSSRQTDRLQWGRDDGVAEDDESVALESPSSRLQWGRDDGVAEDAELRRRRLQAIALLQWGRDDGVAEDARMPGRSSRREHSFNGAATMGSRKTDDRGCRGGMDRGFNGAATMGSRKTRQCDVPDVRLGELLQWGRDDGVAEDAAGDLHRAAPVLELQWGRDDGVAEDAAAMTGYAVIHHGFNGAATMGSRKTRRVDSADGRSPSMLQWGRDDGVAEDWHAGRVHRAAASGFNGAATMGSRKTLSARGVASARLGFNGAATMGSRKTCNDDERIGPSRRFNGAATMGSRKTCDRRQRESASVSSFNGAATMGSRKTRRRHRRCRHGDASMGPRRWGRGRPRHDGRHPAALASMGPRRWGRGRPGRRTAGTGLAASLQWGRDDGVAEDVDRATVPSLRTLHASMGPRRWGRGRREPARPTAAQARRRFNGAATMGSRKTSPAGAGASARWRFNGAATMGSRKTMAVRSSMACIGFNGAATMGSRKTPDLAIVGPATDRASMGPRRWGRGRRPPELAALTPIAAASMGPRRWGRGRRDRAARID